jgi:hypothetical protein
MIATMATATTISISVKPARLAVSPLLRLLLLVVMT